MLARRSQLRLPDGQPAELPLLVPSFSSKGFCTNSFIRRRTKVVASEVSEDLLEFGRTPAQAVLISAFDLHFKNFQLSEQTKNCMDWLPSVRIIFVDSGGYELAPEFDSSEPKTSPYTPMDGFGRPEYLTVLESLKKRELRSNFVISNYDWGTRRQPLRKQIANALSIKRSWPHALHSFIIKPWSKTLTIVDPLKISQNEYADLSDFNVIGVTEKDLGADLLDRLRRVAQLRTALNRAGIKAPIHVWGGLDPILTPLYFFAGAEIFDGLSWLRYAFVDGLAVNRESAAAIDPQLGVEAQRRFAYPMTSLQNRSFLDRLTGFLQQWVDYDGTNFSMFPTATRDHLSRAYKTMETKIPELKGVDNGR